MKKKIGFIDLHIDEWHANNYPAWFRGCKNFGDYELGYAWEESPNPNGKDLKAWCAEFGMTPAAGIEEVIANSDSLCVLAPSNPEAHERLADLALRSGKPLYIDKTFAPDRATAERFFAIAEQHGTPLMSSSALRYGAELMAELAGKYATEKPDYVTTFGGGGSFEEYSIHQIEMIVSALGTGAKSVTRIPDCGTERYNVEYADGKRCAAMSYSPFSGFSAVLSGTKGVTHVTGASGMFETLLEQILDFYTTGRSPIAKEETIEVAAIREAALKAQAEPGRTFAV